MQAIITDSDGKTYLYAVEPLPQANSMARRWLLSRQDTGSKYEVYQVVTGRCGCTCRGWWFNKTCKHIYAREQFMSSTTADSTSGLEHLSDPFPLDVVEWKAQSVSGNRALAVAYIDARAVMDRLDQVLGPANWQDDYTVLPDGNVICRLSMRLNGEWIHKEDVGGESHQQDDGDKRKASFSDALKRAAVKWGVGRYLYRLPPQWVDYDPQKKKLVGTPKLPPWATPAASKSTTQASPNLPPVESAAQSNGCITTLQIKELLELITKSDTDVLAFLKHYTVDALPKLPAMHFEDAKKKLLAKIARKPAAEGKKQAAPRQQTAAATESPQDSSASASPANGQALLAEMRTWDATLAKAGRCQPGELLQHLLMWGERHKLPVHIGDWDATEKILEEVAEVVREFEEQHPEPKKKVAKKS